VYSVVGEFEPSTTLQILDALRTFGPLTRKDVAALGVADRTVCGILAQLERKGRIEVDSTVRPFRFLLVQGLEQLAVYETNR
jgi:Mn-dependent DtxR family transcriptional regulator